MPGCVTGIVLAGGASRRMGTDKAVLELEGRSLLRCVVEPLSTLCDEIVIARGNRQVLPLPGSSAKWVCDPAWAAGPMAGLAAGLAAASHANALVVACDMPFLSTRLLTRLLELVEGCDAAVPLTGAGAQPLHAAYSRECLPTVEGLLRLGASSLRDLLPRLRVKYIDEEQCLKLDPDGMSWFNMNNTDDLLFAKHHLGARHPRVAAA